MIYIGLDIGGTKLLAAATVEGGGIGEIVREETPVDLEEGLQTLDQMIGRVSGGQQIAAIGAAIGGPLDYRTGVVSPLHQPQWRRVPLKARMEERWGCPFYVDVDTNVAALGEYLSITGPRPRCLLYVTVSTGMGGGLVIDGQLYRGTGGAHPEIAHQSVQSSRPELDRVPCECGAVGCLEGLISGNAIRRIYSKPAEMLTSNEWKEVAYHLAQGLRNAAALYCPDEIVLGGGVALGGGDRLVATVSEILATNLRIVPIPTVRLSRHGYHTALFGALALAEHASTFGFLTATVPSSGRV